MIGYIEGQIKYMRAHSCIVNVQGVGYEIFITDQSRMEVGEGDFVSFFTYLNVREDALQLYGFLEEGEYDLFLLLLSVDKIGPKVAMGILSGMSPEHIRMAIASENIPQLVKLPGIGKKSAERLVLELKDKIQSIPSHVGQHQQGVTIPVQKVEEPVEEALSALISLGYREQEVYPIVEELATEESDVSQLIKKVLSELGKK